MNKEVPQVYLQLIKTDVFNESALLETYYIQIEFEKKKIKCQKRNRKTDKVQRSEEILFLVKKASSTIRFKLIGINTFTNKEVYIACLDLPLTDLLSEDPVEKNYHFAPKNKKFKDQKIGKLLVLAHYTYSEKFIFDKQREEEWRKKYKELIDLLLEDNFEILFALTDVANSVDTEELAKILIEILHHRGSDLVVRFINDSIWRETKNTIQPNQLFRSDSTATFLMSTFAKKIGKNYLIDTLKKELVHLIKSKQRLEIDPLRLQDGEMLSINVGILKTITIRFLEKIFSSYENCPMELKQICNTIYESVKNKFPEYKEISVAGFFFLRFICPAIIYPESFEILDNVNVGNYRRNLILITKIIQRFANHNELGSRDINLKIFSGFLKEHVKPLDDFLMKICTLPENEELQTKQKKNPNNSKKTKRKIKKQVDFESLILLHKHLISYIDKIDTLLSKDEDKIEDEEGTGSSLLSILGGEDPVTRLAMLLNEYQKPPSSTGKKLHSVQNHIILSKKAMKINENVTAFLVQEKEDSKILNISPNKFNLEARKGTLVVESLLTKLLKLYNPFLIEEEEIEIFLLCKKKSKGTLFHRPCKWKEFKESKDYETFKKETFELNSIDLTILDPFETITFWINLYNLFYLHASVENEGCAGTIYQRKIFNNYYKYNIASTTYSIDDILQGVFRGNPKRYKGSRYFKERDDARRISIIHQFSPYFHFALSSLEIGSPMPYIYHTDNLEKELILATDIFLNQYVDIATQNDIQLIVPIQFKWNKSDFGKSDDKIYHFILNNCKITESPLLKKCLSISEIDFEIKFQNNFDQTLFKDWKQYFVENENNQLSFFEWKMKKLKSNFDIDKGIIFNTLTQISSLLSSSSLPNNTNNHKSFSQKLTLNTVKKKVINDPKKLMKLFIMNKIKKK
ncbi:ras gtpase-activating protein [Anaeramoeba flamelloides]|uniref:Ras gtpase-activating protein n=1 Tax=Anaeramoeba flamelloides TaxID=1746091 RepID=A0ABQ8Y7P5_9EUKA|nr:ras gtpase-activating protein [Anaeramoeba flamelloides]